MLQLKKTEVWILEDERPLAECLAEMISLQKGLSCSEIFGSYDEMLPVLRLRRFPELMLIDIQLSGIDGIEAMKRVRLLNPAVRFIVFTVSDNRSKVFEAICAGASGYILKSDSFEEISRSIRLVLDGGASLSGSITSMLLDAYKQPSYEHPDFELSKQETEILNLLAAGFMKKEIASKIFLSSSAVDYHLRNIYRKLRVHSQAGAVAEAFRQRLIY